MNNAIEFHFNLGKNYDHILQTLSKAAKLGCLKSSSFNANKTIRRPRRSSAFRHNAAGGRTWKATWYHPGTGNLAIRCKSTQSYQVLLFWLCKYLRNKTKVTRK